MLCSGSSQPRLRRDDDSGRHAQTCPPFCRVGAAALVLFLLLGCNATSRESDTGIHPGDVVLPPWKVTDTSKHHEFIRFVLSDGTHTSGVEVMFNNGGKGELATEHYRIQAAPGEQPPLPLLRAFVERAAEWESKGLVLVKEDNGEVQEEEREVQEEEREVQEEEREVQYLSYLWSLSYLAYSWCLRCLWSLWSFPDLPVACVPLGMALLAIVWSTRAPHLQWRILGGSALMLLATWYFFRRFDFAHVPTSWIVPMHEGHSNYTSLQAVGHQTHAGPMFWRFVDELTPDPLNRVRAIVRMNLWLSSCTAVLFFVLARTILASAGSAILMTGLCVLNPNFINSALSDQPAALCGALSLVAAATYALALREPGRRRFVAVFCFSYLLFLSYVIVGIRAEFLLLFAPATALAFAYIFVPPERLLGWLGDRATRAVGRLSSSIRRRKLLLVPLLLGVVGIDTLLFATSQSYNGPLGYNGELAWSLQALRPLCFQVLYLPIDLFRFLPLGAVLLILIGLVDGFRHLGRLAFAPLGLILIYRTQFGPSADLDIYNYFGLKYENTYFDLRFRYIMTLMPVFFLMACLGLRALRDWLAQRSFRLRRWHLGPAALLGLWPGLVYPHGALRDPQPPLRANWLVTRNNQIEARYLIELRERMPGCTFVLKNMLQTFEPRATAWEWAALSGDKPDLVTGSMDLYPTLADFVSNKLAGSECVYFYHSLDCNDARFIGCESEVAGLTPAEEITYSSLPYAWGVELGPIRLAIYPLSAAADGGHPAER